MSKLINGLAASLAVTMMLSAGVGCSAKKPGTTAPKAVEQKEQLKEATLKVYALGSKEFAAGTLEVHQKFNELLKQELNTKLEFYYTNWSDEGKKYPLLLASGEEIDIMVVNTSFATEVAKGGYAPLNDLLPKHAPKIWSSFSKNEWNIATYEEKISGVLKLPQLNRSGYVFREDLRQKYGLPEIKDVNGLEKLWEAVLKNEKDMVPYGNGTQDKLFLPATLFGELGYALATEIRSIKAGLTLNTKDPQNKLLFTSEIPQAKEVYSKIKAWADKGYWSKNAYSNKVAGRDMVKNGAAASAPSNVINANSFVTELKSKGSSFVLGWIPQVSRKTAKPEPSVGAVIPRSSKNQERALMVLEKLYFEQKYMDLSNYGILNKHYSLTSDGKVKALPAASEFDEGVQSGWKNFDLLRGYEGGIPAFEYTIKKSSEWTMDYKPSLFVLNSDPFKTELAALGSVNTQYQDPLLYGLVDVEKGLSELLSKQKAAGSEKVKAETQKQLDDFMKK